MLSRPSSLAGLIRQSAALRSTSRHPTVIGPVLGIPGSSCLSSTPSGLSLLNYPELPPSTSAGSLLRALPSSFRTSTGHRVGEGNPWHSKTQQPTSRWRGFRRLVRSLSLRPFWLLASKVGRSGSRPPLSRLLPGFQPSGSPLSAAGYNYGATLGFAPAGPSPASSTASLAAPPPRPLGGLFPVAWYTTLAGETASTVLGSV